MKSSVIIVVLAIAAVLVVALEENEYESDVMAHHSIATRAVRGCDPTGCTQFCRKLGHARGVCIGSYCQCRSRRRRSIPETETQITEKKHVIVTRATGCSAASCNRFCQKQGHARGVCIGSYCQCRFQ